MHRRFRWGVLVAAALLALVVGITSYNAGVSRGLAIAPSIAALAQGQAPVAGAPGMPLPYYYGYGWYRPWGWGFHIFPFGLFGLLFVFLLFRLAFGGWGWRRRWYYGGPYGGPHGVPMAFDEWHRRAHDRMTGAL